MTSVCISLLQAKKETVDKVCEIVKKQLALADGTAVTGESKFTELGADSLDTVTFRSIFFFIYSFTANSLNLQVARRCRLGKSFHSSK